MDLRQHFALERTLLAYVRTGLALVGMGFVVARFGMLVRELGLRSGPAHTPGLSLWFGTGLVFLGGLIGPVAWSAYLKHLSRLNEAMGMEEKPAAAAVSLCVVLALCGLSMGVYLVMTRP